MVEKCSIPTCKNYASDPFGYISFHKLPVCENVRKEWIMSINNQFPCDIKNKNIFVCSQHFEVSDFSTSRASSWSICSKIPISTTRKNISMPVYCFVRGCHSTRYISKIRPKNEELAFFKFPAELELRKKWITAICTLNKQDIRDVTKTASICEKHFVKECIQVNGFSLRLAPGTVPSVFPNIAEQCNSSENIGPDINANSIDNRLKGEANQNIYLRGKAIQTAVQNTVKVSNKSTKRFNKLTEKYLLQYIDTLKSRINKQNTVIRHLRLRESIQKLKINCLKTLLNSFL